MNRLVDSALLALILWFWGRHVHMDILVRLCKSTSSRLSSFIVWLMESGDSTASPLGIKLNLQLDRTLAHMLLAGFDWWGDVCSLLYSITSVMLSAVMPSFAPVPYVRWLSFLVLTLCGFSFSCALLCDVIAFITIHINLFYLMSARIYQIQLGILISLWRLFRGQKKNVLRGNRIDSFAIYHATTSVLRNSGHIVRAGGISIDQVILGSLLFVILAVLFPTLAVFYFSLTAMKIGVNLLHVTLQTGQWVMLLMPWYHIHRHLYLQQCCKLQSLETVSLDLLHLRDNELGGGGDDEDDVDAAPSSGSITADLKPPPPPPRSNLVFRLSGSKQMSLWLFPVLHNMLDRCGHLLARHLNISSVTRIMTGERLPPI